MVELGDRAKDVISGFEGIVIGHSRFLYGCDTVGLKPQGLHDGKPISAQWFDINQVEVIKAGEVKAERPHDPKPGGPRETPGRGRD
jgi:hypothetical protein